jgi:hypothetical protein
LTEGLGRHGRKQCLAVGEMLVGRRLRDTELFRKRTDADRLRAAKLRFAKCGLDQRIPEIAMMVGLERLAGCARRHLVRRSII